MKKTTITLDDFLDKEYGKAGTAKRKKADTRLKEISKWLNLSEKTYRTHKTTGKVTKLSLQEHLITLLSLFEHGSEIFGSSNQFKEWLNKENFQFNKQAPIEFVYTISGIKFIDDRLTGIEYGDNA